MFQWKSHPHDDCVWFLIAVLSCHEISRRSSKRSRIWITDAISKGKLGHARALYLWYINNVVTQCKIGWLNCAKIYTFFIFPPIRMFILFPAIVARNVKEFSFFSQTKFFFSRYVTPSVFCYFWTHSKTHLAVLWSTFFFKFNSCNTPDVTSFIIEILMGKCLLRVVVSELVNLLNISVCMDSKRCIFWKQIIKCLVKIALKIVK